MTTFLATGADHDDVAAARSLVRRPEDGHRTGGTGAGGDL
jgi:hypothetical protein